MKKTNAQVIEKQTVAVMIMANFCRKIIWQPKRKAPLPRVVIPPLTILTPMAAIESLHPIVLMILLTVYQI